MRCERWNIEKYTQRVPLENVDATFILGQEVVSICTEAQVGNVRAEWPRQGLFGNQTWQQFLSSNAAVIDDFGLPLGKLEGSRAGRDFSTTCGQGTNILQHFS